MSQETYNFNHASVRYLQHKDSRPPIQKLERYNSELSENNDNPSQVLVHADVLIDLAMNQSEAAEKFIETAATRIDTALEDGDNMLAAGYETDIKKHGDSYINMILRRAELTGWLCAAQGKPIEYDYKNMLAAVDRAKKFMTNEGQLGFIREFMPSLLAARSGYKLSNNAFLARMALTREDSRGFGNIKDTNLSWDSAVKIADPLASFDKPEHRVQLKSKKLSGIEDYRKAGIVCLSAFNLGFYKPLSVADSCRLELGEEIQVDEPYTTAKLNDITTNTISAIEDEAAKISSRQPAVLTRKTAA